MPEATVSLWLVRRPRGATCVGGAPSPASAYAAHWWAASLLQTHGGRSEGGMSVMRKLGPREVKYRSPSRVMLRDTAEA